MDEAIIKYYRNLLRTKFENAGIIEHPSLFVDTSSELNKVLLCGNTGDFMQLFVNLDKDIITDIKYNCCCDPPANVAVEILCILVKGKTVDEVKGITEQDFSNYLGTNSEDLRKKARGLLELLNLGINRYKVETRVNIEGAE